MRARASSPATNVGLNNPRVKITKVENRFEKEMEKMVQDSITRKSQSPKPQSAKTAASASKASSPVAKS